MIIIDKIKNQCHEINLDVLLCVVQLRKASSFVVLVMPFVGIDCFECGYQMKMCRSAFSLASKSIGRIDHCNNNLGTGQVLACLNKQGSMIWNTSTTLVDWKNSSNVK